MKTALQYLLAAVIIFSSAALVSCSSQEAAKKAPPAADQSLSFYHNDQYYEVRYDMNNNISSLYIDGREIPDNEIISYKDTIEDRLDDLRGRRDKYVYRFDFDKEGMIDSVRESLKDRKFLYFNHSDSSFKEHMKKMKKDLSELKFDFKWDDSTFRKDMKRMKEEMAKLKDVKVNLHFEPEVLRIEMEKLRKELKDMNLNENLKEMKESIRKVTEQLRDKKFVERIDVKIPDIKIELKDLDRKMKNLDGELAELKTELKKLDNYMDETRKELLKDGLIKSEDEEFSMTLKKNSMKINDEEVPGHLLNKYKEIYKKHFGKEVSDSGRIEIR
jgi:hypothetical protein